MCKLPPDMKWSFSKLEAFKHCGMMFKLTYLDNAERSDNGFSDYGTFCHTFMEEWAKGQCPDFALAEEFESRYDDAVTHSFPPFPRGMEQKYFDQGVAYVNTHDIGKVISVQTSLLNLYRQDIPRYAEGNEKIKAIPHR